MARSRIHLLAPFSFEFPSHLYQLPLLLCNCLWFGARYRVRTTKSLLLFFAVKPYVPRLCFCVPADQQNVLFPQVFGYMVTCLQKEKTEKYLHYCNAVPCPVYVSVCSLILRAFVYLCDHTCAEQPVSVCGRAFGACVCSRRAVWQVLRAQAR